jgi:hypothetical protein
MTTHPSCSRASSPAIGRLLLVGGLLLATARVLVAAGALLPAPPIATDPAPWLRWLERSGSAGALMSGVRLAALALTAYLLAIVVLHIAARASGLTSLIRLVGAVGAPWTRRFLLGAAGVGMAASVNATAFTAFTAFTSTPAGAAPRPMQPVVTMVAIDAAPPTMRRIDPGQVTGTSDATDPTASPRAPDTSEPEAAPTMRRIDPEPAPEPTSEVPTASASPIAPDDQVATAVPLDPSAGPIAGDAPTTASEESPSPPIAPMPSQAPTGSGSWTIAPGDHLWSVAARTLAGAWHRPPDDPEIAGYVSELIEANRSILVVPGDADLVLPGQVFTLPAVAPG